MIIVNQNRIKNIISDCRTETALFSALRAHKIKYSYCTEFGRGHIKITCKTGVFRIFKTGSRFTVQIDKNNRSVPLYPIPTM